MKMRFWQKTYIFTLLLFLLCLNVGVLAVAGYTYRKNVEAVEAAVSAEQHYIAMSFERDYEDMTGLNSYNSPSLLMESFGTYYGARGVYLAFEAAGETLYSNFRNAYTIGADTLLHTDFEGERHILISATLCDGKYQMIFAKNVASLDAEFHSLMVTCTLTAAGVSAVLALCLYFILKKLSAPLEALRKTTEMIEKGDFSVTAEEKGNDEFTMLAGSFNAMLAKIQEQMAALEEAAARKQTEAEQKQMLVDNMAHELRTPLTSIHGYAEFIEKANTTDERKLIAAKYIVSESERLQKISEILLDGAFIRENEIKMENIDLRPLLSDVAGRLAAKAANGNVEIVCDASAVTVRGNETLLSMLLYNLTENAIKACAPGGRVRLSCADGRAVIEDNGKGMTVEQLAHITEPFYRTDKSRSRAEGGAGLGLSLCRQIACTHGAQMEFASEPGKGTKVTVVFTTRQQPGDNPEINPVYN